MTTYQRGSVELKTWCSPRPTVSALIIGAFAVHPAYGLKRGRWTVTHIRTGLAVGQWYRTRADAIDTAKHLMRMRVDWDFANEATFKGNAQQYRRVRASVIRFLRTKGASVMVLR